MPRLGSIASRSSPTNLPRDNYQIRTLSASTSGNAEEHAVTVAAAAAETAEAERPRQPTEPEATRAEPMQRAYRNTRVSVTKLKHHQDQDAEQICSFDVTNPTFEKVILSELVAYEEEDAGTEENDEPLPEFQPFGDDPEGPNLHVEEEAEIINIGTAEEIK